MAAFGKLIQILSLSNLELRISLTGKCGTGRKSRIHNFTLGNEDSGACPRTFSVHACVIINVHRAVLACGSVQIHQHELRWRKYGTGSSHLGGDHERTGFPVPRGTGNLSPFTGASPTITPTEWNNNNAGTSGVLFYLLHLQMTRKRFSRPGIPRHAREPGINHSIPYIRMSDPALHKRHVHAGIEKVGGD